MTNRTTVVVCLLAAIFTTPSRVPAAEIGFIEDFALAADRAVALKQLIPGTEDYYYYHSLHYQNTQQFEKVDELLPVWINRYNYTARVNEILNRQALLTFEKNPKRTLTRLREQLDLRFDHQRESLDARPDLATQLDEELISRPALTKRALARYENLQGFEAAGLESLALADLNPVRRRDLLSRLTRPDYPNLVKLITDDLATKESGGFGSLPIHNMLLLSQLDNCLITSPPGLIDQQAFVNAYLARLKPPVEVDWQQNPLELAKHLDRLQSFVSRLSPVHNSLKAHVLYHRLALDRSQGVFDQERLLAYLKLPRPVRYVEPKLMQEEESRRYPCNLGQDFRSLTLLPPIGDDEPLVRSLLLHYFVEATGYENYTPYVQDEYLKPLFAEGKILSGRGDPEQWYSLLSPQVYQHLKERVDLDFAETNKLYFAPEGAVSVDLWVKNVDTLIIKVFEINTTNFCRQRQAEVNTDVDLDGLVANEERSVTYNEPPLNRVARHFEFPTLNKRGVYVIDFIGNGKSSRALIRKGRLRHLVRTSSAGHVFTILDENNQRLPKATLWLAGQEYQPDKSGQIVVPFTASPQRQKIVLSHEGFSSLDTFQHEGENYALQAGIYVDRESLIVGRTAQAVVRSSMRINGMPAALSLLTDVKLVITSTDLDGVATTKTVPDFKLHEDRESVFELSVPPRMMSLNFTLSGKVESLTQSKKVDLAASQSFKLNGIDSTARIDDLHLSNVNGVYVVDLLGKSGEARPDRAVKFSLKHRQYRDPVELSLKTDAQGRIALGALADIDMIVADREGQTHRWFSRADDQHTYYREINALAGDTVRVPYLGRLEQPDRTELSLLEMRGGTFYADRFAALSIQDGLLHIDGLGAGEYHLLIKPANTEIRIRMAAGERREGYVLGRERFLETRGTKPLTIAKIEPGKESLTIQLENANATTRVHVFATRYQPAYPPFGYFDGVRDVEPLVWTLGSQPSVYMGGRNLGDEYRYIIDRKLAKKFQGNMLARPGLLLNPWAKQSAEMAKQEVGIGDKFRFGGARSVSKTQRNGDYRASERFGSAPLSNLDFLDVPSAVLLNLRPDKNGVVTIERKKLGPHQEIQVVAVDLLSTTCRHVSLPETPRKPVALALAAGLDPKQHFTQQKQIGLMAAGGQFKVADVTATRFEVYDSLPSVYALYVTLNSDPKLAEFSFILNWHKLKPAEQRELYSKYACHELNFFLMKKDPKFFAAVVKPYLANKRDKTFLDYWLLEDDLKQYMQPWNHARLNTVEKILLAQRIAGEGPRTARSVNDLFDLTPPNLDRFTRLFETAVGGRGLDSSVDPAVYRALISRRSMVSKTGTEAKAAAPAKSGMPQMIDDGYARTPQGTGIAPAKDRYAAEVPVPSPSTPPPPKVASPRIVEQESEELLGLEIDIPPGQDKNGERAGKGTEGQGESLDLLFQAEAAKADATHALRLSKEDIERRNQVRQLYRQLDATQEWAENNYYQLPREQQNASLVTVNAFWNDYAAHDPQRPFLSPHLAEASRNFTEIMFALAVLDLPAEGAKHETKFDGKQMTLTAASPLVVFHEQVLPTDKLAEKTPILVSENFFRADDRYRFESNRRYDKYVSGEFLTHVVYGCQVVVTNPTSAPRKLDVLLQIPAGAMPVQNGRPLRTASMLLEPYQTRSLEYFFYFPAAGKFAHYPVQVSQAEELLASTEPAALTVVVRPSQIDRTSWDFISQHGEPRDVIEYLKANNLYRTNLERIAWRMREADFYRQVISLLTARHVYYPTLWSYSVLHSDVPAMQQYLQHADSFVSQCGPALASPLLTIDPVARGAYEHLEYRPLVNPRVHQLGRRRQILNDRLHQQYEKLLAILSCRSTLKDDDLLAVTCYMLMQDRTEEAHAFFQRVNADRQATRMQFDYCAAYLNISSGRPELAASIAAKYKEHPVDRWRNAFGDVAAQSAEKGGVAVVDAKDRDQQQAQLAALTAAFDFKIADRKIALSYQNLEAVEVRYYLLDIEVLFSNNPFVQDRGGAFSAIRPNLSKTVKLPKDRQAATIDLPAELRNNNVLVEISGGGQTRSQAHYANSLVVQVSEPYGQLTVAQAETAKPLSTVYVKVYARLADGQVKFFKDGYTDHRGRFDYASLSTNELDNVQRFSVLVLSDQFGAVVREADPPKR